LCVIKNMSTAEYAVYIQRPCENWIEKLTVGRGFPKSQKKLMVVDGKRKGTLWLCCP